MLSNRKGFTLIELLIVVVIIGILAAIAIPKFAATKDKAKLASVKTDLRNMMTAQEAYFSDFQLYAAGPLAANFAFSASAGNVPATVGTASGFTASVSNASITGTLRSCSVGVGGNAASTTVDGQIVCP